MSGDTLSKRLKNIKREVLAIKTAHRRGLGRIRFYRQIGTWEPSDTTMHTLKLTATFSNPLAKGLTQLGLPTEAGFTFGALLSLSAYQGGAEVILTAACTDASADFTVVASEYMQMITVEELS